jgi:peptidoglycan/xylan/chitin deacetylase (PgdA/CDA1 family)
MKWLYPGVEWNYPEQEKTIYITFDDGPVPEVTPKVLEILREYGVKATFFCIGDNVRKYPELYHQLLAEGHRVGNHSYSHYNAWKVSAEAYLQDVEDGARLIESNLFRPPYGKLTWQVLIPLRKKYRIVMWDVISCDFDETVSAEQVYRNVTENARPGSVIVFHDSIKAAPRMIEALPEILNFYSERAYQFKIIHPAIQ